MRRLCLLSRGTDDGIQPGRSAYYFLCVSFGSQKALTGSPKPLRRFKKAAVEGKAFSTGIARR